MTNTWTLFIDLWRHISNIVDFQEIPEVKVIVVIWYYIKYFGWITGAVPPISQYYLKCIQIRAVLFLVHRYANVSTARIIVRASRE